MKMYKLLFLFLLSFSFLLTSCGPDGLDETTTENEIVTKVENNIISRSIPTGDGLDLGCVAIEFPFQFVTINDNTVDITSVEDLETAFYDTTDYVIDFVYPLTVTTDEGETVEVANIDELGALFAACIPDQGWSEDDFPAFLINQESSCYDFLYPLTLVDLDGNAVEIADENAFIDALASNDILFFAFPLALLDLDGEVVTVNSADELFLVLSDCEGVYEPCDSLFWGGDLGCYNIQFPVSFMLADGTTITAEDLDELNALILNQEVIGFAYPLTLVNIETGEVLIVNSEEELEAAFVDCYGVVNVDGLIFLFLEASVYCFDINYPVNVYNPNGDVTVVGSLDELFEAANNGNEIELPVTVTTNDGEVQEITTIEELFEILENC